MKCIHCGYENEGDFCLKCHKLIRDEYLSKGFDDFISKPVSREKLYEVVKKYL